MTIVARFINKAVESHQLPTEWIIRNHRFSGAQVLTLDEAMTILARREHSTDDWYKADTYSHIALIKVSGFSGERGTLVYDAITEDDVEEMRVAAIDSCLDWSLMEIAMEMAAEGYDIDEQEAYESSEWIEDYTEEIAERLWDEMSAVEVEYIETV